MSVEQQISYCTAADGVRVAYATYGNDGAAPVVYLTDLPGQEALWASTWGRRFMEELARYRRLITFDFGGFGASQRNVPRPGRYDLFAADLAAVADHLSLGQFDVFAAGMGPGMASIMYAGAHAERVTRLALFSPRITTSDVDSSVAESIRASFKLFSRSSASLFFPGGPSDVQRWFSTAIVDWTSAAQFEEFLRGTFDLSETLSRLTLPVLILHRKGSQVVSSSEIREAASLIPGARLVTLEGVAGVPYWDFEQYIDTLREFLGIEDSVETRTAALSSGSAVILFTDIVSSTELTERMGDTAFRDASRALDAGLRAAIRDAGGVAVEGKLLGDGVLATFGSAAQAIEGARRCLALSAASELGLHIGLHAGDVIREEVDGRRDVFGGAVNIAARICGLSAPGEILVSDVVRGMARSSAGVVFEDRGEREMKGVGEAVRVYVVRADGVVGD